MKNGVADAFDWNVAAVEIIGGGGTFAVACVTIIMATKHLAPVARDWIAARKGLTKEMLDAQREERANYRKQIDGVVKRLDRAETRAEDAEARAERAERDVAELRARLARHESR